MKNTFLIADLHFGDENIIKFERRPFVNTMEMDGALIENWNSVVTKEDEVIVVGDMFRNRYLDEDPSYFEGYMKDILNRLNGEITLVKGNHDQSPEFFKKNLFAYSEFPILYSGFYIISHEPAYVSEAAPYANIFGHVHGNPNYKTASSRGYCVSAERIHYKPILFSTIAKTIYSINNPTEEFE